ncbi:LacI family DNA-binding transcriptional regulator [Calidithermus timidus]|jgi:LacI family transcriptional regulator|uniref:LacI family DNA-binding transcriptional regulator n=1 Tax=Calidithermus timidus TaxID=307124 RepID=UPI0003A8EC91|nr:LacI family DNA-binding transcriptional regulator [Calidithermus timidus]
MSDEKVTLAHVARLAGVSMITVSKVLNNKGRISEATRARVLQAASQLGYVANTAARSLRGRPTQILGMVIPELVSPYFAEVARAAADAASQMGYDLAVFTTSRDPERERERVGTLLGGLADGLVFVVPIGAAGFLATLERSRSPVVLVNHFGAPTHLPVVRADSFEGSLAAVRHLMALGHRRIGFVGGASHSSQAAERLRAYRECMMAAGLWDEQLVRPGDFTQQRGVEAGHELLSLENPPTAIFAASDLTAFGVIAAARSRGLQVPEDLSVVGFDDIPAAAHSHPGLTTVAHPIPAMAQAAVELIARAMAGEKLQDVLIEFPSELVVRGSSAPPPALRSRRRNR